MMMHRFGFLLLFSHLACALYGQQHAASVVFSTPRKTNLLITGIGLTASIGGYILEKNVVPYSQCEIQTLPFPNLTRLDRKSTLWNHHGFKTASDFTTITSAILPILLLGSKQTTGEKEQLLFQWSQVTSITWGITSLTKTIVQRDRPLLLNPNASLADQTQADARLSFFSGHTSITAASWFFLAQQVQRFSQKKWLKRITWVGAFLVPAFTGYARMRAGKHYFTDVATGYLVGGLIGHMVPVLHVRIGERRKHKRGL